MTDKYAIQDTLCSFREALESDLYGEGLTDAFYFFYFEHALKL